MIRVKALRGVCIGPEKHLAAGDKAELEVPLANYLASIGAVEHVKDEPKAPPAVEPEAIPEVAEVASEETSTEEPEGESAPTGRRRKP